MSKSNKSAKAAKNAKAPKSVEKSTELIAAEEALKNAQSNLTAAEEALAKGKNDGADESELKSLDDAVTSAKEAVTAAEEALATFDSNDSRTFVDGQYTVLANLKHNGKLYRVGDSIALDENEAKSLLADGTIE